MRAQLKQEFCPMKLKKILVRGASYQASPSYQKTSAKIFKFIDANWRYYKGATDSENYKIALLLKPTSNFHHYFKFIFRLYIESIYFFSLFNLF